MRKQIFTTLLLIMALGLNLSCSAQRAPAGKLIYCSYADTHAGGLGKDYCELIADEGTDPKVVVVLNRENHLRPGERRAEYTVEAADVERMQQGLAELKVHKLNGYRLEEAITGGTARRIYMEYSSGDKIDARWYGSRVKDSAITAYNFIRHFFEPWRARTEQEVEPAGAPEEE